MSNWYWSTVLSAHADYKDILGHRTVRALFIFTFKALLWHENIVLLLFCCLQRLKLCGTFSSSSEYEWKSHSCPPWFSTQWCGYWLFVRLLLGFLLLFAVVVTFCCCWCWQQTGRQISFGSVSCRGSWVLCGNTFWLIFEHGRHSLKILTCEKHLYSSG